MNELGLLRAPEDIILHKLYWHTITPSDRQLGDVAGVIAVQKDRLDQAYLRSWGNELKVSHLVEKALAGQIRPKNT